MFLQRKLGIKKIVLDLESLKKNPKLIDNTLKNWLENYNQGHSTKTT